VSRRRMEDAVLGVEGDGGVQEGDGGMALLVGQHTGEGEAGVIVDGDVQSLPAGRTEGVRAATARRHAGRPADSGSCP
jgi:hypothetical protein